MDQALVDAALGDLGCPVWVNQLAGYHHAAAPVQRPGEGVHVEADQRAVGTERLAGGDADRTGPTRPAGPCPPRLPIYPCLRGANVEDKVFYNCIAGISLLTRANVSDLDVQRVLLGISLLTRGQPWRRD